ncbi:MAG TPA: MOSC N-terminal beta barrel domain-containing protein [Burkholderiaceae bacterium]|nr:MOSC N-terminal beta barrel domain-containing protein [Burkholderiaceae bacterium]
MTAVTLTELHVYPVKGCAGTALKDAVALQAGLAHDRGYMVVDAASGRFITQRTVPAMALIRPSVTAQGLRLSRTGQSDLDVDASLAVQTRRVTVWRDTVDALDCGDEAAAWITAALGRASQPLRLVKFSPQARRLRVIEGRDPVAYQFADGYPLLVVGQASLDDLNQRIAARGLPPVPMNRFRPNVVVAGLAAWEEDHVDTLRFGSVELKLVAPCSRCEVPNVEQSTGESMIEPMRTLATFRALASQHGEVCVGMNAIVSEGAGGVLRVGQAGEAVFAFD